MKLLHKRAIDHVRGYIIRCQELGHIQQVAYSTYHDALTQVCFDCDAVRTSIGYMGQKEPKSERRIDDLIIGKNDCLYRLFNDGTWEKLPEV